jgi:hypothetical protein
MLFRPLVTLALVAPLVACGDVPPNPGIGFDAVQALPPSARLETVLDAGGRIIPADALRSLVAAMGEDAFLQAIGGRAGDDLLIRPDAAACIDDLEPENCRRIVADGMNYRVFTLDGEPLGTLGASRG